MLGNSDFATTETTIRKAVRVAIRHVSRDLELGDIHFEPGARASARTKDPMIGGIEIRTMIVQENTLGAGQTATDTRTDRRGAVTIVNVRHNGKQFVGNRCRYEALA